MLKINNLVKYRRLFLYIVMFGVIFLTTGVKVSADEVDLLAVWPGTADSYGVVNRGSTYDKMPEALQKVIPKPKEWSNDNNSNYPKNTSYPVGQCTWWVWSRADEFGITYDNFEGNGGQWGELGTGSTRTSTPTPHAALSTRGLASSSQYGHVMFVEYIDSKGNLLISEGNVRQHYGGQSTGTSFAIITKAVVDAGTVTFVLPPEDKRGSNFGKNPDGTISASGTDSSGEATDSGGTMTSGGYGETFDPFNTKKYIRNNLGYQDGKGVLETQTLVKLKGVSDAVVQKIQYVVFAMGAVLIGFVAIALLWYIVVPKLAYGPLDKLDDFFGVDKDRTAKNTRQITVLAFCAMTVVGLVLSGAYLYPIIGILSALEALIP